MFYKSICINRDILEAIYIYTWKNEYEWVLNKF